MGTILSTRERQVVLLVTRGLSNKKIARELGISAGTVKHHVHHILQKLNVERRQGIGLVVECAALQQVADYPVNPNAVARESSGNKPSGMLREKAAMNSTVKKRSLIIGSHNTSISLEDSFWTSLRQIAREQATTVSEIVRKLDASRDGGNLSSAIRVFVLDHYRNNASTVLPSLAAEFEQLSDQNAGVSVSPNDRRSQPRRSISLNY